MILHLIGLLIITAQKPEPIQLAKQGTLIVRGHTQIGSMFGLTQQKVFVETQYVSDFLRTKKSLGVSISIKNNETVLQILLDQEEVSSLISNLARLEEIKKNPTPMESFEVTYRIKDFSATIYSDEKNEIQASLDISREFPQSGRVITCTCFINFSQLKIFRELLTQAKSNLANLPAK